MVAAPKSALNPATAAASLRSRAWPSRRRASGPGGLSSHTAGSIAGDRGSPLGTYDQELWRAPRFLDRHHSRFQPGVNEDLAATAVWGSQQAGLFRGARYDGVFGLWYGKGPGVDRSGDVLKHANLAGTSAHGGVLALAGDDHAAQSSTSAHQSESAFMAAMIPVLHPANVHEIAGASARNEALHFGVADYAASTKARTTNIGGVNPNYAVLTDPDDASHPLTHRGDMWP